MSVQPDIVLCKLKENPDKLLAETFFPSVKNFNFDWLKYFCTEHGGLISSKLYQKADFISRKILAHLVNYCLNLLLEIVKLSLPLGES